MCRSWSSLDGRSARLSLVLTYSMLAILGHTGLAYILVTIFDIAKLRESPFRIENSAVVLSIQTTMLLRSEKSIASNAFERQSASFSLMWRSGALFHDPARISVRPSDALSFWSTEIR